MQLPGGEQTWTRRRFVRVAGAAVAGLATRGVWAAEAFGAPEATPGARAPYVSRPDLRPPPVAVSVSAPGAEDGYILMAPFNIAGQATPSQQFGPLIVDNAGEPVWFLPRHGVTAIDLQAQTYRNQRVLTWYEGDVLGGYGGTYGIYDSTYHRIGHVAAGRGEHGDLHEFLITSRGTALITIYRQATADLTPIGGPAAGPLVVGIVQEIDIPTGKVLFEWRSTDHVALTETYMPQISPMGNNVDYFHLNSVGVDADGDLLISARHTSCIYKVDRKTGKVKWRLGGKKSDFTFGPGAAFSFQHDARRHKDGTLTLFDNGASLPGGVGGPETHSRPMRLALDMKAMYASLVVEYDPAPERLTWAMGNLQQLPKGNLFVGWGTAGSWTEFTSTGDVVLDASFADGSVSYRAFRFPWVGRPTGRPAAAALRNDDGTATVYASWNGATEVASWLVRAGASAGSVKPMQKVSRSGFETAIPVGAASGMVTATALDGAGGVLGTSEPVALPA